MTILLTTHQPEEAERCDRIAVLDGGRVIACGTPDELRARVGGDVVRCAASGPEELAAKIARAPRPRPRASSTATWCIEAPRGHELIPRLVELFPPGRLRRVAMRRPTLADVFVKLTGRGLAS